VGECLRVWIFRKQAFCDFIHAHVGALSGQDGRDQQLKRIFVVERTGGIGISVVELRENGLDPFGVCSTAQSGALRSAAGSVAIRSW